MDIVITTLLAISIFVLLAITADNDRERCNLMNAVNEVNIRSRKTRQAVQALAKKLLGEKLVIPSTKKPTILPEAPVFPSPLPESSPSPPLSIPTSPSPAFTIEDEVEDMLQNTMDTMDKALEELVEKTNEVVRTLKAAVELEDAEEKGDKELVSLKDLNEMVSKACELGDTLLQEREEVLSTLQTMNDDMKKTIKSLEA